MPKSLIAIAAVVVLVIAGYAVQRSYAADNAAMPEVGQTAPTFTLPNQEGQPVDLSQYHGKVGRALLLSQGHDHRLHHRGA